MTTHRKPKKISPRKSEGLRSALLTAVLCTVFVTAIAVSRGREGQLPDARAANPRELAAEDIVLVPAPTRNIARGEKLSSVPFTTIKWPKSRLTAEYLADIAALEDATASTALPKYLPVPIAAMSGSPGEGNRVTERIPQGMRAITVRVDVESAVEGWAQSGNSVDVILVRSSVSGLESKVIAENVRILSAGRSAEPSGGEHTAPTPPSTVTLLVNQEDALRIKTANSIGKLTFALRGSGDGLPTVAVRLDQKTLIGLPKSPSPAEHITGTAFGPDGQKWILGASAKWTKAEESH